MDKFVLVGIVFVLCIVLVIYTQLSSGSSSSAKTLKQKLQNEFPKYKIIEKSDTLMICEISHRNEPEELVIIRIDSNQKKNIRTFGRRATITYPKQPSIKEIKKDVVPYLD